MRSDKRKRLEAAGWRVGDAADFLGLSPEEVAYVEIRLRLAEGLKTRRAQRGLTQQDVAKAAHSSQSRIAKMEAGDPTVSLDLLVKTLLALGATERDVARIIGSGSRKAA
jgi:DNA-binding XRE family transcriptional regulator